jgi:DNA-binding MurR/RpiR family transcriptional regulator
VEALQFARDREAISITITDSQLSPAAQVSEFTIIAPSNFISFTSSYTACLSIINLIITLVAHKSKSRSEAMLEEWEKTLTPFDFFYK